MKRNAMLHIIAYDITSDKRLRRVAAICEDYGMRIEKSVFECELGHDDFEEFWHRLERTIADGDSVIDYPIPDSYHARIRTLGASRRTESSKTIIF